MQGRINYYTDIDYFKYVQEKPGIVDIAFGCDSSTADLKLFLYYLNEGNLIEQMEITDGEEVTVTIGLNIGEYYLKVEKSGDIGQEDIYSLTLSTGEGNVEYESNNTYLSQHHFTGDSVTFRIERDHAVLKPLKKKALLDFYGALPSTRPYLGVEAVRKEVHHKIAERIAGTKKP